MRFHGLVTVVHRHSLNGRASLLASFVTVLSVIRSPSSVEAESDLSLAQATLLQVKLLGQIRKAEDLERPLGTCMTLQTLAEKLVTQEQTRLEASEAYKHVRDLAQ